MSIKSLTHVDAYTAFVSGICASCTNAKLELCYNCGCCDTCGHYNGCTGQHEKRGHHETKDLKKA